MDDFTYSLKEMKVVRDCMIEVSEIKELIADMHSLSVKLKTLPRSGRKNKSGHREERFHQL